MTVAEMLNEPVAQLLPLLDEATDAGLVVSDGVEPEFRSTMLWQLIRASLPANLRTALLQQAAGRPVTPPACQEPVLARLGEKERTIAQLAAEGLTNQQIARRVFLSPHTVNYHMRRIFRKLAVTSRIELARLVAASRTL
jgi:DNA-binding NarL/FixJ family response regulator